MTGFNISQGIESSKYDWVPGERWRRLIYTYRIPDPKVDPGIMRTSVGSPHDPLCTLLLSRMLEGQALKDALELCPVK